MALARKDDLTPLKRELLESLESRRTNQEIAEALRIDERTVETHVAECPPRAWKKRWPQPLSPPALRALPGP